MRIFIGSSEKAKKKAETLRTILMDLGADVVCWYDLDLFLPGRITIDSLIQQTKNCHAAAFILNEDDVVEREEKVFTARDNVIAEAGFFVGALGKDAVVLCRVPGVHIPTDFKGVTYLEYNADDRDYMRNKLRPWLSAINGDRLPKSKNNLLMLPREELHGEYPITKRLHIEDGGYKSIKRIRLLNIASSLLIDPHAADPGHGAGMPQAFEKILRESHAVIELVLLEPTSENLRIAATQIANPSRGTREAIVYSAWESLCSNLSSDTVYREAYEAMPKRFICYSLNIGIPYALFNVEFNGDYSRFDHVKIDLYSSEIDNEDHRRSFIIWRDLDRENYDFFVRNFNNVSRKTTISHQPTLEEIGGWITTWKNASKF